MLDQMEIARESEDDDDSNDLKYLVTILPDVIDKLKEHGQVEICKKMVHSCKRRYISFRQYMLFIVP